MPPSSSSHTVSRCPSAAACDIIDFETKPEVSGNDEIASAPIDAADGGQRHACGTARPRSEHLRRPVISSTEPADISSSAL